MDATFYGMKISHPSMAAELMLEHKGVKAKRVEIPPASQRLLMRRHGFAGGTVPGLKLDGDRVMGTTEISRVLEERIPSPSLYPSDETGRQAVREAEEWGDRVWQPVPRRIFRWAVSSDSSLRTVMAKSVGLPAAGITQWAMWPLAQFYLRYEGGGEAAARRDVGELPEHLDEIERLISAGVIGGAETNAADFQIGASTRVLLNFPQLKELIAGRPAGEHAMRIAPRFGREMPVKLPAEWLP